MTYIIIEHSAEILIYFYNFFKKWRSNYGTEPKTAR